MSNHYKEAILITHPDDIELFKKNEPRVKIACEYPIIETNKSINLEYFLEDLVVGVNLRDIVGDLISNWYRDERGIDIISNTEVGIGAMLQYRLSIIFSNSLRYYIGFVMSFRKYEKLLISSNSPKDLLVSASYFGEKIEFYNSENQYDDVITSAPNRGQIVYPRIKKYFSYLARSLQKPILNQLKNRVLIMNDWTYRDIDNSECLNLNTFNFFRSFYLKEGRDYFDMAEKSFPQNLKKESVIENVDRIIDKYDLNKSIRKDIKDLFCLILNEIYLDEREMMKTIYCSTLEMFDYYSPAMVITPGYAHPHYQAIYGIAKSRNIPRMFIIDGFPVTIDKNLFPMCKSNNEHMISHFGVMGSDVKKLYKKALTIKDSDMIDIFPPILRKLDKKSSQNISNIVVLFPTAMPQSPYSHWDQRFKYVLDIIGLLNEMGEKKIKVKMKTGTIKGLDKQDNFLRNMLDENDFNHVEIVGGEFSSCLDEAKYLIGQLSSSVVESIYSKKPYYIYEPHSMGMPDEMIDQCFINNRMISDNLSDLKEAIIDEKYACFENKQDFVNTSIEELDYRRLISSYHSHQKNLNQTK